MSLSTTQDNLQSGLFRALNKFCSSHLIFAIFLGRAARFTGLRCGPLTGFECLGSCRLHLVQGAHSGLPLGPVATIRPEVSVAPV